MVYHIAFTVTGQRGVSSGQSKRTSEELDNAVTLLNESYWSNVSITTDSIGDEYCLIPATSFLFGSSASRIQIQAAFYIGKHPVSRWRFEEFVRNTGHDYSPHLLDIMQRISPEPECPATPVSWYDAKAYARWLRASTQEYYSLPSVEEWEVAARGTDGRLYPWGNDEPDDERMRYSTSLLHDTTRPVGRYPAGNSQYGCQDMAGNVWEWTIDPIDEEGKIHMLRGGSCVNNHHFCNCVTCCCGGPPEKRILYAGFRLIYLTDNMYGNYVDMAKAAAVDVTQTLHG